MKQKCCNQPEPVPEPAPAPETASETTQETSPELQTNPENYTYTYRMHLQDLQDAVTYSVDIGMSRIR
ncbi:MAG: hypothetical protein IIY45_11175 [Firmicutes bacterium]|nr:hypothetical protein [Bacillota bacterium]